MSTINQQPDALSLAGNLKPFEITSDSEVVFVLQQGDTEVLNEKYQPDSKGLVTIDVRAVTQRLLDLEIPLTSETVIEQTTGVSDFTALIDGSAVEFRVIKGGVAEPEGSSAQSWLEAHLLTWQPQEKMILQYAPEWLGIYPLTAGEIMVYVYFGDGSSNSDIYASLEAGKLYSVNTSWGNIAQWVLSNWGGALPQPIAWDVFYQVGGTRMTPVQRYQLRNPAAEEHIFVWTNTLGGIDSVSFTGAAEEDQKLSHKNAVYFDESIGEYDIEKTREIRQSTGYLTTEEGYWLKDFYYSRKKHVVRQDGSLRRVAVVSSKILSSSQDDQYDYEFTYRISTDGQLLNLERTHTDLPAPEGLADFFLTDLLSGLTEASYADNLILAVQSPYAVGWQKLSLSQLIIASGGGSVSRVALELPTEFDVIGEPVTVAGTLMAAWKEQLLNLVFASPAIGASGTPGFRSLVAGDIPELDFAKITTGVPPFLTQITKEMIEAVLTGEITSHTHAYLSEITALMISSALGFTPYDQTNPANFISSVTKEMVETVLTGEIYSHTHPYQPIDEDLTAIAGITDVTGILRKTSTNNWMLDDAQYLTLITKAMVEAVLTGAITSHTHAYQPLDGDLTSIASLAGTTGLLKKTAVDTFILDTAVYLTAITSLMVTTALGFTPENSANKSSSPSLGTSDTLYPTQKAVKTYADSLVAGLLDYRGGFDASGIAFPSNGGSGPSGAIMKGDMWVISVGGSMGGVAIQAGDSVIANTDTPGQSAINWNMLNSNISYVPEDQSNKSTATALGESDTLYPSQKAVKAYADTKQSADADLTAIAALAGTLGLLKKTAANTWALDTSVYLTAITKAMIEAQLTGSITSHTHAYQPVDADLTAIAALAGISGLLKKTAADTWALDTSMYLTAITKAMIEAQLTGAITTHTHAYQPVDTDLTAIAALSGTSGILKKTAADTWTLDTSAYLTAITKAMIEAQLTGAITTHTHDLSPTVTDDTSTNAVMYLLFTTSISGAYASKVSSAKLRYNPWSGNLYAPGAISGGSSVCQNYIQLLSATGKIYLGASTNPGTAGQAILSGGPAGGVSWGDVQPKDADLTAIATLSGTSGILKKTAADTWALEQNAIVNDGAATKVASIVTLSQSAYDAIATKSSTTLYVIV